MAPLAALVASLVLLTGDGQSSGPLPEPSNYRISSIDPFGVFGNNSLGIHSLQIRESYGPESAPLILDRIRQVAEKELNPNQVQYLQDANGSFRGWGLTFSRSSQNDVTQFLANHWVDEEHKNQPAREHIQRDIRESFRSWTSTNQDIPLEGKIAEAMCVLTPTTQEAEKHLVPGEQLAYVPNDMQTIPADVRKRFGEEDGIEQAHRILTGGVLRNNYSENLYDLLDLQEFFVNELPGPDYQEERQAISDAAIELHKSHYNKDIQQLEGKYNPSSVRLILPDENQLDDVLSTVRARAQLNPRFDAAVYEREEQQLRDAYKQLHGVFNDSSLTVLQPADDPQHINDLLGSYETVILAFEGASTTQIVDAYSAIKDDMAHASPDTNYAIALLPQRFPFFHALPDTGSLLPVQQYAHLNNTGPRLHIFREGANVESTPWYSGQPIHSFRPTLPCKEETSK